MDEVVFGALAEQGELFLRQRRSGEREDGERGGDLYRGRRAEPGAEGDVAAEVQIEGGGLNPALLELAEHADWVVGPVAGCGGAVVAGEREVAVEEVAVEVVGVC